MKADSKRLQIARSFGLSEYGLTQCELRSESETQHTSKLKGPTYLGVIYEKANARLIAAAPDLLAAVDHLIHYAEKLESAADLGKETGNITLDKYRELVAKAKGSPC